MANEEDVARRKTAIIDYRKKLLSHTDYEGLVRSEGYCWTRTAERQASRLRARYLKVVMRQDGGYFDLHVTNTTEVIESISSDSLVIQEVISEKVPVFVMSLSTFLGAYAIGFILLWRLAVVGFSFIVLLIVLGLIYGRALMSIARKMRDEYDKAGVIVEQSLSSMRTVYSFVGESKTTASYFAALQGTMRLGLRQGLAKGLVIGSNGIVFAIWYFLSYYGSRLVMYHGAQGSTVFVVGTTSVIGGLSLGSGLSTLKYFSEASAAAERIKEVMDKVPKIDSDSIESQLLETLLGDVEFRQVEFAYPSSPESTIFADFNLRIPAGKTVALVGGSGSGKSTVIALLQRFYDPLGGTILLDGVAIKKLKLKWLRSQMGLVSQEPALFATSIKKLISSHQFLLWEVSYLFQFIVPYFNDHNLHKVINFLQFNILRFPESNPRSNVSEARKNMDHFF